MITHGIAVRTANAGNVKTAIDAGSSYGKLNILSAADVVLATATLLKPSMSQDAAVLTLLGVPLTVTSAETGTATKFNIVDSDDVEVIAGSCGMATGTPSTEPDLTVDNSSIVAGQTVKINGFTYTAAV